MSSFSTLEAAVPENNSCHYYAYMHIHFLLSCCNLCSGYLWSVNCMLRLKREGFVHNFFLKLFLFSFFCCSILWTNANICLVACLKGEQKVRRPWWAPCCLSVVFVRAAKRNRQSRVVSLKLEQWYERGICQYMCITLLVFSLEIDKISSIFYGLSLNVQHCTHNVVHLQCIGRG